MAMGPDSPRPRQPWRIVVGAIAGLLAAVAIAGAVAFVLNLDVDQVTDRALKYDLELEDEGDDVRVAVLNLRHFHRNIVFTGPTRLGLTELDNAMAALREEIGEYAALGIEDPALTAPARLEELAAAYYDSFRPAIDLYESDRSAFTAASDAGLVRLEELERAAEQMDRVGEDRAAAALTEVDQVSERARLILLAVLVGLGLAAAVLGYAAFRVLRELRRLAAAQEQAAVDLGAALQAKADFIADASHELRTPLTVLRGNAEVGLAVRSDCDHEPVLREIVSESIRMTKLVEDLLFLARSDAASLELERQDVAIELWLAELAVRGEVLARERGVSFEADLLADGQASIDPRRIEQAILVLVDNAAKYGAPGGLVTLRTASLDGQLTIAVGDDGPGIDETDLPHIFERFYRVDKTRTRSLGGAGLGLPIARTIVEAHGGRITAESQVGRGTTMTVRLPLAPTRQHQPIVEPVAATADSGSADRDM